jgi:hypothetical protein
VKLKTIEEKVTAYIQQSFTFVVFPVEDKVKRLGIESKIISTVSLCDECRPSQSWLGLVSPKEKIRRSGLWIVNELWKSALSPSDMDELKLIVRC